MCFSAEANFTVSAILLLIGLQTVARATSSQIMFASIPLLFSAQQCCEGILWLTLSSNSFPFFSTAMTYSFLFFAFIIWPIWIPYSLYMIEKHKNIRTILTYFSFVGIAIAAYLTYILITYGASSTIMDQHIYYSFNNTFDDISPYYPIIIYSIPVIGSFFVASRPLLKMLGGTILITAIITGIFWEYYFTSVWCFFAALLSIMVIIAISQINKKL